MKKRKRSMRRGAALRRETIQFRTGGPLKYGPNRMLPRTQERVPRSLRRPLITARRAGMTALARSLQVRSAERVLHLQVARKRLVRPTLRTSKSVGRFVFRSPFFAQYKQLKFAGNVVRNPKKVALCIARKMRREVLFAFKRTRRMGSGRVRRTADSLVSC